MTAEQARQFSRIYGKERATNELKRIKKQVEESSRNGCLRTFIGSELTDENKRTLRNLGYIIIKSEIGYWVSWDERDRDNG